MIWQNIGMMALRKNVSDPPPDDWTLQHCPSCGQECYYQQTNGDILKTINPKILFLCSECALKEMAKREGAEK